MPKDATKNIDRYKIRGGQLNEFDFHQNQEELAEKQQIRAGNLIPGTPPEEKAEGLRPIVRRTQKAAKKNATKATKARKAAPVKRATAKKLAARKATKKK